MIAFIRPAGAAGFARRPTLAALLALAMLIFATAPLLAADATYPTPEAAMAAFRAAVYGEGGKGILDLFGREYEADLVGGDPAEARQNIQALRRMAAQRMTLEPDGEGRMTIIMGRRGWPMPIPLVKSEGGWTFDVKAGVEEITDRRIGRNELAASSSARPTSMRSASTRRRTATATTCCSTRRSSAAHRASATACTGPPTPRRAKRRARSGRWSPKAPPTSRVASRAIRTAAITSGS
jgi:hypothetical protein